MNELRMPKHQPFEYDLTPETLARWSRAAVCPACYGTGILELLRERLPCTLCSGGGRIGPLAALENAATPSVAPTAAGLDPIYEQVLITKLQICGSMFQHGEMTAAQLDTAIKEVEATVHSERQRI